MAREFRPYIAAGIGSGLNINTTYVVENGALKRKKLMGGTVSISLKGAYIEMQQGLIRKGMDVADVLVKNGPNEMLCNKMPNAKEFVAYLEAVAAGNDPDAKASSSKNEAEKQLRAEENAWYRHLTDEDLDDYVYVIPELPDSFVDYESKRRSVHIGDDHKGLVHQFCKAGERIMSFKGFDIIAPTNGMFLGTIFDYNPVESGSFVEKMQAKMECDEEVIGIYRPLKGAFREVAWSNAYTRQQTIERYLETGKRPWFTSAESYFVQALPGDYQRFKNTPLGVAHVADLPSLHPSLESYRFAQNSPKFKTP
ncbi:MAG: hypothetical protein CMH26_01325 [Micavibrio sp.]|nr:hypothetical protein [Micavibrio sp.]|tara:strand:- start:691 stop:1620 length:930 start_codon:yes stop_codon:yes gene_type:complete